MFKTTVFPFGVLTYDDYVHILMPAQRHNGATVNEYIYIYIYNSCKTTDSAKPCRDARYALTVDYMSK